MYHNGEWGTVCDDSWGINDARVRITFESSLQYQVLFQVVCSQVRCGPAVSTPTYGPVTGPVWLEDVQCTGNEEEIEECPHSGWEANNCDHSQDAGVYCRGKLEYFFSE